MRIINQIEGVWGAKRRVGDCGGTPADNLPYKNRNGTGLQSFLQKINLKNFLKSIASNR